MQFVVLVRLSGPETPEWRRGVAGAAGTSLASGAVAGGVCVLLGMQVQTHSGDLSRDLAAALEWALTAEPSSVLSVVGRASIGARYGDLIVDEPIDVTVHPDFSWWLEEVRIFKGQFGPVSSWFSRSGGSGMSSSWTISFAP